MADKSILEILVTAKDEAASVLSGIGDVAKGALTVGLGIATVAVGALSAAIAIGTNAALDWAMQLDGMSDVTGLTTEQSAAMSVILKEVGGSATTFSSQIAFMSKSLVDNEGKLGTAGQALTDLGVSFTDANGNMLPTVDILQSAADKLDAMPSGLEKTEMMMKVFGKSGKDLTDVLSVMANEGIAKADEKAKAFGLSMSGEVASGAEQMTRKWEDIKMMGQGLLVTFGTQLLPVLQPIIDSFMAWATGALPIVQAAVAELLPYIQDIANWLGVNLPIAFETLGVFWTENLQPVFEALVTWLATNIPPAIATISDLFTNTLIPAFTAVWDFLSVNFVPILMGVLAALGVVIYTVILPAFIAWATTAATAAIATITALAPILVPILAIGAAVALLVAAWQNDWGGIRTTLTDVWTNTIQPILAVLWDWLSVQLTAAIQTLTTFWTGTLQPAMLAVWDWVSVNLIPLFKAIGELLGVTLTLVITAFAGLWQNVLQPALEAVWKYLNDNVFPIFKAIGDLLSVTLGPIVKALVDGALTALKNIWDGITKAIQDVITWIEAVIKKLKEIQLPDWLTPGSASPFELSLLGIADAMAQLANVQIPAFTTGMARLGSAGTASIQSTEKIVYNHLTVISNANAEDLASDYAWLSSLANV